MLLVAGGEPPSTSLIEASASTVDLVVAVDGGADALRAAVVGVDVLVGDLDSVTADTVQTVETAGATVVRHPVDKDASDLELALTWLTGHADGRALDVVALGVTGGRLDHELVALSVLAGWAAPDRGATVIDDRQSTTIVTPSVPHPLPADAGQTVTLLAVGGAVDGVTTSGLRWPLADATLTPHSSLGLSNVATRAEPTVECRAGRLLAVVTASA